MLGNDAAVRLRRATKRYGGTVALDGLDLEIAPAGVTAILGPNGAGKSTAVGLTLGRLLPDAGEVLLFGLDPRDLQARRRVGAMLQSATLPAQLTVREQVTLFAGYYPDPLPVAEAIRMAGLDGLEDRRCQSLSGGQQRRVQFALALVGRPDLLVLDEPTVGLDLEARRALWATVRSLVAGGAGVVLTTHHLEEAEALADRIVVIDRGRVLADGTAAGIKSMVATRTIHCRTALADAAIRGMPGVRSVSRSGVHIVIATAEAERTLRTLFAADPDLSDLTVAGASLEEAFVTLTTAEPPGSAATIPPTPEERSVA